MLKCSVGGEGAGRNLNMSWMKCYTSLPLAAGFLFIGLPYSFCLVAHWIYGWPTKPGYKKYIEALKPRRVYCLTIATLGFLKYLQYGRLYFQLKSWYKNEDNSKFYKKGIIFGRRGNKLDLYHPLNMNKPENGPTPLVVFIYGGAWDSGERSTYCLLSKQMADELNTTVVCPDYSIYPKERLGRTLMSLVCYHHQAAGLLCFLFFHIMSPAWVCYCLALRHQGVSEGTVLGMVQDIADCLLWAQENGQRFSFDKDNIVLIGHSAGAHLCALTTLFLIEQTEELFIESKTQQHITSSIRGIIGLSGVYNILEHYEHEQKRGIEYVSTMHKAMHGVENFPYYSPTHLLKRLSADELNRVPPFALLHGTSDIVVPVKSSTRFSELLTSLSVRVSLYLLPEVSHTEIVADLMLSDRRFYHPIFSCIKQEFRKLQDTR